jgi:hypothetical protein
VNFYLLFFFLFLKRVVLKSVKENKSNYEWVICRCPCRLDLSGGWYNLTII